jgi:crossover junction endodeoxyribonuclease RuvC
METVSASSRIAPKHLDVALRMTVPSTTAEREGGVMVKTSDKPGLAEVEEFVARAATLDNNIYVGIDPGAEGAISFLCANWHCVIDIPTVEVARVRRVKNRPRKRGPPGSKTRVVRGKTKKFDNSAICAIFEALNPVKDRVKVCLEIASPMVARKGGNNLRTAFLTGAGYMLWPLFLTSKGFSLEELEPEDWKREFGLIKKDKEASRLKARALWPRAPLSRKKDHNRAEALLLAEALRRRHGYDGCAPS